MSGAPRIENGALLTRGQVPYVIALPGARFSADRLRRRDARSSPLRHGPPSAWGYAVLTFTLVQLKFLGVTLYLHRDQSDGGLILHPLLGLFFRFCLAQAGADVMVNYVVGEDSAAAVVDEIRRNGAPRGRLRGRCLPGGAGRRHLPE